MVSLHVLDFCAMHSGKWPSSIAAELIVLTVYFRWATVPIVKVAQEEKFVDLPSELDVPWTFLRRRYGIESLGGGLMSNFFCNFDTNKRLVYQVNAGMPEPIPSAEYAFATSFNGLEREVYKA